MFQQVRMGVLYIVTFITTIFIVCLIIGVAVVLFVWWLRLRKIKKNIPEDMEEKINKEKQNIKEVLKYGEEQRKRKRRFGAGRFEEGIREATVNEPDNTGKDRFREHRDIPTRDVKVETKGSSGIRKDSISKRNKKRYA